MLVDELNLLGKHQQQSVAQIESATTPPPDGRLLHAGLGVVYRDKVALDGCVSGRALQTQFERIRLKDRSSRNHQSEPFALIERRIRSLNGESEAAGSPSRTR